MDPYEGYFSNNECGEFFFIDELHPVLFSLESKNISCVLLNDPDRLTDSSKTAESLSENVSV